MSKSRIAHYINLPITALFAVGVTFWYPEYALIAWIIFIGAAVIKLLDL